MLILLMEYFNIHKVIKLLKAINVSKATGHDKIPNRLLKLTAEVVALSLNLKGVLEFALFFWKEITL